MLIDEAVAESTLERRTALLIMADHWAELLRYRRAQETRSSDPAAGVVRPRR